MINDLSLFVVPLLQFQKLSLLSRQCCRRWPAKRPPLVRGLKQRLSLSLSELRLEEEAADCGCSLHVPRLLALRLLACP